LIGWVIRIELPRLRIPIWGISLQISTRIHALIIPIWDISLRIPRRRLRIALDVALRLRLPARVLLVCGILIAKERLLAVPITTQSASYKLRKRCPEDGIDRIVPVKR
jgi:hypothetical protein